MGLERNDPDPFFSCREFFFYGAFFKQGGAAFGDFGISG